MSNESGSQVTPELPARIVESLDEALLVEDGVGRIRFANAGAAELLGYEDRAGDLLGLPLTKVLARSGAARQPPQAADKPSTSSEGLESFEAMAIDSDGRRIPVVVRARPLVEGRETAVSGRLLTLTPVRTDQEPSRARLRQQEEHERLLAETLIEVAETLSGSLDRAEVLPAILDLLARVVDYDSAAITLLSGEILRIVAHRGLSRTALDAQPLNYLQLEHVQEVLRTQQPLIIADTRRDDRWHHIPGTEYIRCWLGVPLTVRGMVIGLLNLDKTEPDFYQTRHSRYASAFAHQAAIAIENASLYSQAHEDAEMKAELLREVNHRVKNNLAAIIGLLYTEQQGAEPLALECDALIDRMTQRIQSMAAVHTMLSASEWAPLRLDELVQQVIRTRLQLLPDGKELEIHVQPSTVRVTAKQANDLALAINELTSNTIQHGLRDRDAGRLEVAIAVEAACIVLQFHNDGPDYPDDVLEQAPGMSGLKLVRTLVRHNLRGEFELSNDDGPVTTLRFRLDPEGQSPTA